MFDELQKRVTTVWAQRQRITELAQIDPANIAMVIQLIMSLITSCIPRNTPEQIRDKIQKNPVASRVAIWMAARQTGLGNRKDIADMVETAFNVARGATVDEISKLHSESVDFNI